MWLYFPLLHSCYFVIWITKAHEHVYFHNCWNLNFGPTGSCYQKCNNLRVREMVALNSNSVMFGDSDSSRVTLKKMVTRLESSYFFHKMTWLESQSMNRDSSHSLFYTSLSFWWTKPVRLHTKKWAFLASVMIKIGENFLFCHSSRAVLHFCETSILDVSQFVKMLWFMSLCY